MSLLDDVAGAFADLGGDLSATATLTRTTPGAYDPVSGTDSGGTTVTSTALAVLDSSSLQTLGYVFGDGLVQTGDIQATLPAKGLTFDPAPGDVFTAASMTFRVIGTKPTYAGSVPVMWNLLVRK